ncbi:MULTISPECIES: glycoside hydrolase family 3 C-terminal domain-containing protein [unclassified Ligilactobacillus]|uniref:glycoside hydrolase family 3 C-terminal domain-containing protein n=1 Tax=unclassified Ligilactobacillus TaxID=2767920 RepID=UPI003853E4A9
MKEHKARSLVITLAGIAVALLVVIGGGWLIIQNLLKAGVVQLSDITTVVTKAGPYFIPLGILFILIIIGIIAFFKKSARFNFMFKWQSLMAFLTALGLTLNVVVFGPLAGLMNCNFVQVGKVNAQTVRQGERVSSDVADQGIVLLKNKDNFLPLKNQKKVNVFGWASTNPVYDGSGSGQISGGKMVNIYDSLHAAGFETNNHLERFYQHYRKTRPVISMSKQDWTLPEPKTSSYSTSMMNHARKYSDTAVVVIARSGGEGADLPKDMGNLPKSAKYAGNKGDFKKGDTYLQLSQTEKNMLAMVNRNFKNVVVVVNSANPMELGFLNQYDHIKGAVQVAGPGAHGFTALGKVLSGKVDPSGRTVDTYVYDLKKTPTFNNFGDFHFANDPKLSYVRYVENIYDGYKFYETYYLNNQDGYKKAVQYPFGYGLSYTKFNQQMSNLKTDDKGNVSFTVTVKNTGKVSGRDVVQVYYTAPYTNGGIEKAATNLLNFAKTKNLKPGESQTIRFHFNRQQMASYDESNGGAYVLDPGKYQIQLKNNAHDVIASKDYMINQPIRYAGKNKMTTDKRAAHNEFQDAEGKQLNITYLSRKDNFANYSQATAAPGKVNATPDIIHHATVGNNNPLPKAGKTTMPAMNKKENIELVDLRGKSYNDPRWQKLISKLSVKDMAKLIGTGGYQTIANRKIGKVHTNDFDGPAGFSSFFAKNMNTTGFPVETMIGETWNKRIARQIGQTAGKEGKEIGLNGWYAPSMDLHRSAFGGRDFEYYSEDGTLSGYMAANTVKGARQSGVYPYIKHFAMNEQETNRMANLTEWATEQDIRENNLRPFKMAVEKGHADAAMNAFNFIGDKWCGENSHLLNNVLRSEWGFHGLVCTDYFVQIPGGFMNASKAVMNGTDLMLAPSGTNLSGTSNPKVVRQMQRATHNILYTVVNSNAYAHYHKGQSLLLPWEHKVIDVDIAAVIILLLAEGLIVFAYRKKYVA